MTTKTQSETAEQQAAITFDEYRKQEAYNHQHILNKLKNTTYKLRIYPTAWVEVEEVFSITHEELEAWANDHYEFNWREEELTYEDLLEEYKKECKESGDGGELNISTISKREIEKSVGDDDNRDEYIEEAEWEEEDDTNN